MTISPLTAKFMLTQFFSRLQYTGTPDLEGEMAGEDKTIRKSASELYVTLMPMQ